MLRVIEQGRATDPMIGVKVGGRDVLNRLMNAMRGERGVQIESLLCALGALAGYACQDSARTQAAQDGLAEDQIFIVAVGADGHSYLFGDLLNAPLAESPYSVWALAAGAAHSLGCETLPDCSEIFKHVSDTVGGEVFGVTRLHGAAAPGDLPIHYVRNLWPQLAPIARKFCQSPGELPMVFGIAIQLAMEMGKAAIVPELALRLAMESAVPMSKITLSEYSVKACRAIDRSLCIH